MMNMGMGMANLPMMMPGERQQHGGGTWASDARPPWQAASSLALPTVTDA